MLNDNFKIAINNSMFSGLATFSHTGLSMVSGSVNCSPWSDNTFGMVYKAATVNRTGYETYSAKLPMEDFFLRCVRTTIYQMHNIELKI